MKNFIKISVFLLSLASTVGMAQTNSTTLRLSHYAGTPAYQEAVAGLMLAEAEAYVGFLRLPENFPLSTNLLKEIFVSSPYLGERFGILGSLATTNFSYGFGKGKHLTYITKIIKGTNPYDFEANKPYAIAPSAVDTNAAYQLATQYLAKAYVNVARLATSSVVTVEPWVILKMTTGKYTVQWERDGKPVVKVVIAEPQKELWTLRVEDSSLILRPPLVVSNLDFLLSQTNAVAATNAPAGK